MKRLASLSLACVALVLATGVTLFLASPYVQAGKGIQMFSGTFTDQNLPVDGVTKITLVSIPFSTSATMSKLEVTSFVDVTPNSAYGYAICELDVDDIAFFSGYTDVPANSTNVGVGLTSVTIGIKPGSRRAFLTPLAGVADRNEAFGV